jgi:hypothetical protein
MKVLVDGVEVPCQNDVKVIYENEIIDFDGDLGGRAVEGNLHVTLNHEGMVADTFASDSDESYASMWQDLHDIISLTH